MNEDSETFRTSSLSKHVLSRRAVRKGGEKRKFPLFGWQTYNEEIEEMKNFVFSLLPN